MACFVVLMLSKTCEIRFSSESVNDFMGNIVIDVSDGSFRSNRNNMSLHDDADDNEDDDEEEHASVVLSPLLVLAFVVLVLPHAPIVCALPGTTVFVPVVARSG